MQLFIQPLDMSYSASVRRMQTYAVRVSMSCIVWMLAVSDMYLQNWHSKVVCLHCLAILWQRVVGAVRGSIYMIGSVCWMIAANHLSSLVVTGSTVHCEAEVRKSSGEHPPPAMASSSYSDLTESHRVFGPPLWQSPAPVA